MSTLETGERSQSQIEVVGKIKFWEGNPAGDSLTLYSDPYMERLNETFDISTLKDPQHATGVNFSFIRKPNAYPIEPPEKENPKEYTREERRRLAMGIQVTQNLWDILAAAKGAERFVGLNQAEYSRFIDDRRGTGNGFLFIGDEDPIMPGIRVEEFEGQKIYFPTEQLVKAFGVKQDPAREYIKNRLDELGIKAWVGLGAVEEGRRTLELRTKGELSQDQLDMISKGSPVRINHIVLGEVRANVIKNPSK